LEMALLRINAVSGSWTLIQFSENASLQVIWSPFFRFLFIPPSPLCYRAMDILSERQTALTLTNLTAGRSYGYKPKQSVILYISATTTYCIFKYTLNNLHSLSHKIPRVSQFYGFFGGGGGGYVIFTNYIKVVRKFKCPPPARKG
jgi:hypothetical protein